MFGRQRQAAGSEIQERYSTALALWGAQHDADRHDLTPGQHDRWLEHVAALNGGFRLETAVWWRWLVRSGRLSGDTAAGSTVTAADHEIRYRAFGAEMAEGRGY